MYIMFKETAHNCITQKEKSEINDETTLKCILLSLDQNIVPVVNNKCLTTE
jgi:hypothetical protein